MAVLFLAFINQTLLSQALYVSYIYTLVVRRYLDFVMFNIGFNDCMFVSRKRNTTDILFFHCNFEYNLLGLFNRASSKGNQIISQKPT